MRRRPDLQRCCWLLARCVSLCCALLSWNGVPAVSARTWQFTGVTQQAGIDFQHGYLDGLNSMPRIISSGVAVGDYNRDGWDDLYVVRGDIGPNLLFRNLQNGTFQELGATAGVDLTGVQSVGPAFADFDGDGWLDLFVGGIEGTPIRLFRNRGDGSFEDVTISSGLTSTLDTFSAAFGDYDRDGDLDLFLTHWDKSSGANHLWRNEGNGTFTAADASAGILGIDNTGFDLSFTPIFADINNDGWPDLLIAADFGTSRKFINNGNGTFTGADVEFTDENGMGASVCDYDHDGDLDWFVSSIWEADGESDGSWGVSGNRLYGNLGDGSFVDVTDEAGVRAGHWGWGSSFADFNNDGHPDLFHVNGWAHVLFETDAARMFVANGNGSFTERAAELGVADTGQGRGIACFDYDHDGDIDIFIANNSQSPVLYRNDGGNAQNHLTIILRGEPPNTQAVGARIYVTANGVTQMRELRAGCNFSSQDPVEAHFGMGLASQAEEVRIVWPDGDSNQILDVAVNQRLVLNELTLQTVGLVPVLTGEAKIALVLLLAAIGVYFVRHRVS